MPAHESHVQLGVKAETHAFHRMQRSPMATNSTAYDDQVVVIAVCSDLQAEASAVRRRTTTATDRPPSSAQPGLKAGEALRS